MRNESIKQAIKESGVYQYQVAMKLGVSEMTLIRWFRTEMSVQKRKSVMKAVQEIVSETSMIATEAD